MRLSKLMAERGLCSRREADDLIARGLVKVDGQIVDRLGSKVEPDAQIEILGQGQRLLEEKVTILLNKPIGYVSSQPEKGYRSALELIRPETQDAKDRQKFNPRHLRKLGPAGRLDIDSQGLLIFSQDGRLAKHIIGENSPVEKEYLVRVAGSLPAAALERLRNGSLVLEGRRLRPAVVEWINQDQLRFILREGLKRQIRKMCEAVGLQVLGLKRVRIGHLRLGSLAEGQWRYLQKNEKV